MASGEDSTLVTEDAPSFVHYREGQELVQDEEFACFHQSGGGGGR